MTPLISLSPAQPRSARTVAAVAAAAVLLPIPDSCLLPLHGLALGVPGDTDHRWPDRSLGWLVANSRGFFNITWKHMCCELAPSLTSLQFTNIHTQHCTLWGICICMKITCHNTSLLDMLQGVLLTCNVFNVKQTHLLTTLTSACVHARTRTYDSLR